MEDFWKLFDLSPTSSGYMILIITIAAVVISVLVTFLYKRSQKIGTSNNSDSDECPYPNCVRCSKKNEILSKAFQKLKHFAKENENLPTLFHEIEAQLKKKKFKYVNPLQKPVVFYLPQLNHGKNWQEKYESQKFYTKMDIKIREEYKKLKENPECVYKENSVPSGSWKIYHVIDQGERTLNSQFCPTTLKFCEKFAKGHNLQLMDKTVFGTVAFSCVSPFTVIPEHYGPTNIRMRCQYPINCRGDYQYLEVGLEKKYHNSGVNPCSIYFDDSFLHAAVNFETQDRVVLIMDFWHPDLKKETVELLKHIFSSE